MAYNLTNMSDTMSIMDFIVGVNQQANGMIGMLILLSILIICFVSLKAYETKRAFTVASFITLCVSIMFNWIGIIDVYFTIILMLMTIGGVVMLHAEGG